MVQGTATIPPSGATRLEASVLLSNGEVRDAAAQEGKLKDLLRMEKQVVVDIAQQMGYTLSEAEMRVILENGTQNLAAFLAYSNGLEAEDLGDFDAAAAFYGQAVQSDPNFRAARTSYQSTSASTTTQGSPGAVTTAASTPPAPTAALTDAGAIGDPLSSAIVDVAATDAEATAPTTPAQPSTTTSASQPPSTITVVGTPPPVGVVRIFFLLP
jgi:septal ring-binding cell division protein DamX